MNRLQIRDTLVQYMETAWASNKAAVPVFYRRQQDTLDMQEIPGDWFIKFTLVFERNDQANLAPSPFLRTSGRIEILLFGKEGQSDRTWQQYLDTLVDLFRPEKIRALGTGITGKVPTPGRYEEHDGWCSETLLVPFFADSNT
jgi:hypothetical protein